MSLRADTTSLFCQCFFPGDCVCVAVCAASLFSYRLSLCVARPPRWSGVDSSETNWATIDHPASQPLGSAFCNSCEPTHCGWPSRHCAICSLSSHHHTIPSHGSQDTYSWLHSDVSQLRLHRMAAGLVRQLAQKEIVDQTTHITLSVQDV